MKYFLFLTIPFLTSCNFLGWEDAAVKLTPTPPIDIRSLSELPDITQVEWWVVTLRIKQLNITKESYIKRESFPYSIHSGTTTQDVWDKLISSINLEEFDKLPEYPATWCPSCADSPEEYITLTYGTGSKTIKYNETLDIIPTVEPARKILKDIYKNGISSGLESGISEIRLVVMMWLSCPNCKDEITITPDLIQYDKVILNFNTNTDTQPPTPIHFSWSLSSEKWMKLISWIWDGALSELSVAPPPPDWEGIRLIVHNNGWEKVYIIFDEATLNPRITELLNQIKELKQFIRNEALVNKEED